MCRKIGCNRNVCDCINRIEFGRVVLNFISYFCLNLLHLEIFNIHSKIFNHFKKGG